MRARIDRELYVRDGAPQARRPVDRRRPRRSLVAADHWSTWLRDHSDVADLLRDYRLVATVSDIEIRAKAHLTMNLTRTRRRRSHLHSLPAHAPLMASMWGHRVAL